MCHDMLYFEHQPRRLDDVQKDIANIAQKVSDMAAEEALVGSLGCIPKGHMGIILLSSKFLAFL